MFNLWTDDETIVVVNNEGKEIICLNEAAKKRVFEYLRGEGTPIPTANIPVDSAIEVLSKLKNVEPVAETPIVEVPIIEPPVFESSIKETPILEEPIVESHEEESWLIRPKYKSLYDSILHLVYRANELTIANLKEAIECCIDKIQYKIVYDELANEIYSSLVYDNINCLFNEHDVEKILMDIRNEYNKTGIDFKIDMFEDAIENHYNLKEIFNFIKLNCDEEVYRDYKVSLYAYLRHFYTIPILSSKIYTEEGKNILKTIKNFSPILYNLILKKNDVETAKKKGFDLVDESEIKDDDPFYNMNLSLCEIAYNKLCKRMHTSEEEETFETGEETFETGEETFETDEDEPIFPRPYPDDDSIISTSDDEKEDEEGFKFKRIGQIAKEKKIPVYVAGASGLLLVFAGLFGVNPLTVWRTDNYNSFSTGAYNVLLAAFALSGGYELAKYLYNLHKAKKAAEENEEVLISDDDLLFGGDSVSYDEEPEEEEKDDSEYSGGYRRFNR